MSTKRITFCLLMICLLAIQAARVDAQHYQPFGPVGVNHDFQLFAPAIVDDYGDISVPLNTGFFFTYDRTFLNVSRPENTVVAPFDGDFGWGNRYTFGYETDEKQGWMFSFWQTNGPGLVAIDDLVGVGGNIVEDFYGNPIVLRNSVNVTQTSGFEINKTYRLKPLHNGTVLEPFFGARFIQVTDRFRRETYAGIFEVQEFIAGDPDADPPVEAQEGIEQEDFTSLTTKTENNMVGGQLGLRTIARRGHWFLTTETRGFVLYNTQFNEGRVFDQSNFRFTNGDVDEDPEITFATSIARLRPSSDPRELVYGGQLNAEAAYEITREMALRFGFELIALSTGVGRGTIRDDTLLLAGLTFGFTVNR